MSRRISTFKRFAKKDNQFEHILVSLLTNKILLNGKKRLARKIIYKAFVLIENKLKKNPIFVFEKAVRNISPYVIAIPIRYKKVIHQTPILLNRFRTIQFAIGWIVEITRKPSGKSMIKKLATELTDAYKGIGNLIKKRDSIHRYAESNRAFARFFK